MGNTDPVNLLIPIGEGNRDSIMKQYDAPVQTETITETGDAPADTHTNTIEEIPRAPSGWRAWLAALRQVFPIYLAVHLALLVLTYCATLFILPNFSQQTLDPSTLLKIWYRWDTGQYIAIATNGYTDAWRTAFFPLYPLIVHFVGLLTGHFFVAGLLISNVAGLAMLVVLYRLVEEDFDRERAWRSALYLSVFLTAFFFAAAYSESLFLLLMLLSFYYMRRGRWWLAGLFALLSALTRSAAVCLLLPFCYEYLRQHEFSWRKVRADVLACLGIPVAIGGYMLYCYVRFGDPLAFSHAEELVWHRHLHTPWYAFFDAVQIILQRGLLHFDSIHAVIDLAACIFILVPVILAFVGPWKFPRPLLVYALFAALMYIYSLIFPGNGHLPLGAFSRYLLEVFPAVIVLAAIGKSRQFNLYYLTISTALLAFMLLQFLTDHWII